jgi:hypothetical protein
MSGMPHRGLRCCFFAALLVAALPQSSGYAQSTNQMTMTQPSDWLILAKKGPLLTYDDGKTRKDGYKIVSTKTGDPNFLGCDESMDFVDVSKLTNAKAADCGSQDWHGIFAAYVNAVGADGEVHLVTPRGNQIIAKSKWDELVKSVSKALGPDDKTDVKVGDFAAFTKDEKGHYATMFKLAPNETGGGT